jgi:N6-L-threonylcarbamoyladenine synthase
MSHRPTILGIETSCDDTAAALLDGERRVVASVVASQLAHRPYGGVVPEIASREHLRNWPAVAAELAERTGVPIAAVDAVAATRGPGLVGSLLVGLSLGKAMAFGLEKPFFAVHHLEGHLYSPFLTAAGQAPLPVPESFVGLVVSGGHTALYEVAPGGQVTTLAETRDDAIGEAFDKIGKRLGLPYPQGPKVDQLAERGDGERFALPLPLNTDQQLDFSYSGLKSQTLNEIEKLERRGVATDLGPAWAGEAEPDPEVLDLVASFRAAAVKQVLSRLRSLRRRRRFSTLAVSGGAAANRLLRRTLTEWAAEQELELYLVPLVYSGDNAAMIAHVAHLRLERGETGDGFDLDAFSRGGMA